MIIFPAIDLFEGKVVRLYRGDYNKMTVYSDNPPEIAEDFKKCGASHIHIVDLEGAKNGTTPNFYAVTKIKNQSGLFCEVGGGIRDMGVIERYISAGIDRVILGTAAVTNEGFVRDAVGKYGGKIAVGIDILDGFAAIKGWTEKSALSAFDFCEKMQNDGVETLICTDISKDGAMKGTNHALYSELSRRFNMKIIASGGVSSLSDVKRLAENNLYGAIIGKAYYTKNIDLKQAVEVAK